MRRINLTANHFKAAGNGTASQNIEFAWQSLNLGDALEGLATLGYLVDIYDYTTQDLPGGEITITRDMTISSGQSFFRLLIDADSNDLILNAGYEFESRHRRIFQSTTLKTAEEARQNLADWIELTLPEAERLLRQSHIRSRLRDAVMHPLQTLGWK